MSLGELTSPVRVAWDLEDCGPDAPDPLRAADQLLRAGILYLELFEGNPSVSPSTLAVVGAFTGARRAVSLTVLPSAVDESFVSRIAPLAVAELLVHAQLPDEVERFFDLFPRLAGAARAVGLSLHVSRENLRALPGILRSCAEHAVPRLVLPVPRADRGAEPGLLEPDELKEVARRLRAVDQRSVSLVAHDPFLWDALFPEADPREEGCQAANSLLYLSPRYDVYPCAFLRRRLGNLREKTWEQIVASPEKKALRTAIGRLPTNCHDCPKAPRCRGGCRGRAFTALGTLDERDPACQL